MICASGAPSSALSVLVRMASCCYGAVEDGPSGCTCWTPVYDRDQATPDPTVAPKVREQCDDCAFRSDSPERTGDDRYVSTDDVPVGQPFWCHRGMRKPVAWRHPAGIVVEVDGDFYEPPQRRVGRLGVPYKADGSPGDICAGWAARNREDAVFVAALLTEASG